jgi:hypothetical protein
MARKIVVRKSPSKKLVKSYRLSSGKRVKSHYRKVSHQRPKHRMSSRKHSRKHSRKGSRKSSYKMGCGVGFIGRDE